MTPTDKTARSQTESISFEFDLHHSPEKVWRALTDPVSYFPLLPLALLWLTGVYLFMLPYATKWRSGRRAV